MEILEKLEGHDFWSFRYNKVIKVKDGKVYLGSDGTTILPSEEGFQQLWREHFEGERAWKEALRSPILRESVGKGQFRILANYLIAIIISGMIIVIFFYFLQK